MKPKQGLLAKFFSKLWSPQKPNSGSQNKPRPPFNVLQPKYDPIFESFNSKMLADIKQKKALKSEKSELREDAKVDEVATERALLDQLLSDSNLYKSSKEYKELLDFTVRLRNMAPFNAMLLQIQKPGIQYAASAYDWKNRFCRQIKKKARPLLIMWPFGPVALVYDMLDTEGKDLPKDAFAYYATGPINKPRIQEFKDQLKGKQIDIIEIDEGDQNAGLIRRDTIAQDKKDYSHYTIELNRNHDASMQFVTLSHELAHLYLGHLRDDPKLKIKGRRPDYRIREIEAESVAYILCKRNDVDPRSQKYLNSFVKDGENASGLEIYAITRAAGHIERLLNLTKSSKWKD